MGPADRFVSASTPLHGRALELRLSEYGAGALRSFEEVRELLSVAASVRVDSASSEGAARRETIQTALCNLTVQEGRIASYQYKGPFGVLEMSPEGALLHPWWALEDLNL
jgi:hypothetical protein